MSKKQTIYINDPKWVSEMANKKGLSAHARQLLKDVGGMESTHARIAEELNEQGSEAWGKEEAKAWGQIYSLVRAEVTLEHPKADAKSVDRITGTEINKLLQTRRMQIRRAFTLMNQGLRSAGYETEPTFTIKAVLKKVPGVQGQGVHAGTYKWEQIKQRATGGRDKTLVNMRERIARLYTDTSGKTPKWRSEKSRVEFIRQLAGDLGLKVEIISKGESGKAPPKAVAPGRKPAKAPKGKGGPRIHGTTPEPVQAPGTVH